MRALHFDPCRPLRSRCGAKLRVALIRSPWQGITAKICRVSIGTDVETAALWRPTGPEELALVEASGWREWPPRLPDQPIFYRVLNQEYAAMIARDWNVKHSGSGYVTRFRVRRDFLDKYETHQVGGRAIVEYWIPAGDLAALNASIVGRIEVVAEYRKD
jgi:hypothetical protein